KLEIVAFLLLLLLLLLTLILLLLFLILLRDSYCLHFVFIIIPNSCLCFLSSILVYTPSTETLSSSNLQLVAQVFVTKTAGLEMPVDTSLGDVPLAQRPLYCGAYEAAFMLTSVRSMRAAIPNQR